MKKNIWIPFLIILIFPPAAFPEEMGQAPSETFSLLSEEKMVITPSRHLQAVDHSPSTISVITSEEIRASGFTSIPDLLRRIPGMEVTQTTSSEYIVSMRGDNQLLANKLLVLIDGRSVNEELEDLLFWNSFPIGLEEIERIEIVRGPGSAIWGANAFDGVVNIISKRPADIEGTHFFLSGGEVGNAGASIIHAGSRGSIDYKISMGYQRGNQWRDSGVLGQEVYRSNFLVQRHFNSEKTVSLGGGVSDSPRYDGPLFDNGIAASDIRQGYLQGGYEDSNSFFRLYWNTFNFKTDFYLFSPDPVLFPNSLNPVLFLPDPSLNYSFDLYHLEGQHQFEINSTHQVVIGMNYRMTDVRGELIGGRHQIQLLGGYLQEEWTPLEPLTVVLGGRYDDHDFQTMHQYFISPRASLVYRLGAMRQVFRLSYSEAYRPPTPLELFQVNIAGSPTSNLNPERIASYEAGYSALFFDQIKAEVNLYYNRLSDLIDIQGNPISNLTRAEMYGGEVGGELLLTRKLKFFGNYSYQEIHQSLDGIPFPNSAIRAGPSQKINGGGEVKFNNGVFVQLAIHYVIKVQFPPTFLVGQVVPQDNPAYTLVNLQVGYRFLHDKLGLTVSAFNLFHDVHREYPLGDEIGSRIVGQLNLNLD
jgi:iron complex outermembrane receptor protein